MNNLNNYIVEKLKINKNVEDQGYWSNDNGKEYDYEVVYPNGFIEMYSEEYIKSTIKECEKVIASGEDSYDDAYDSKVMFEEILEIKKTGEWVEISGPSSSKGDLQSTIALKFR